MTRQADVSIRYNTLFQDRGVRAAVAASKELGVTARDSTRVFDTAMRANQAAWADTARIASRAQKQVAADTLESATRVNRSLATEVGKLREAGVSYRDIANAAKGWAVSAQETAAAIRRSADEEVAALDRVARARNKMRTLVGLAPSGGRGGAQETRGLERGLVGGVSSKVRYGAGMVGGGLVGGLAGYLSVEGMKSAIESTQQLALQTKALSSVTGMDSKTASEWIAIANARGIASKSLGTSFKALSTQTLGALNGSKASVKVFREMGISQKDLKGTSGDLSSELGLVADHLNKMPGGAEKTALAGKLLGKNFLALMPMLSEGSKKMAEQRKEAAALGVTLGGNATQNAKKLEDATIHLKIAQQALQVQFAEHVAPALISVTEDGIKLFGVLRKDLGPAFHFVTGEVKDVTHWLGEHKTVLKGVEYALIGVAGAFVGLKVIRTAVGFVRGASSDVRMLAAGFKALGSPITALKGLFSEQESETALLARQNAALTASNERLAVSFEAVAASAKGAAGGEALAAEAGSVGGGLPLGGAGLSAAEKDAAALANGEKGLAGDATAAKLAQAAETSATSGGLMTALLGKTGVTSLITKLGLSKGSGLAGDASKVAGGVAEAAPIAADAEKAAGMLGKLGPALGGVAKVAGPIGLAITAFQGADAFLSTHGNIGERLSSVAHSLTFGLIGNDPTNVQQRAQGTQRANVSFGQFQTAKSGPLSGALTGGGIAAYQARLTQLQAQLKSVSGTQVRDPFTGMMVTVGRDSKVMLDREAQIKQITGLFNTEQKAALSAAVATDRKQQGASRWSSVGAQLQAIVPQLNKLSGKFQDQGALSAVKFAAGLEQSGRLPKGATDKLIADLEAKYPPFAAYLQQQGITSMQTLADTIKNNKVTAQSKSLLDEVNKTFGWLPVYTKTAGANAAQKLQTAEDGLKDIMARGTQAQKDAAAPLLAEIVKEHGDAMAAIAQVTHDKLVAAEQSISDFSTSWSKAGSLFGTVASTITTSLGNIQSGLANVAGNVPAITAPSQLLNPTTPRHNAGGWVPGDPHRDGTLILAAGDEFVATGHGQALMEHHAPGLLNYIAGHQMQHFAGGGWVRTGATLDPTAGQAPTYSDHGGMSFAELLEAGTNAGMRPDLTQLLGLSRGSYGMPMETPMLVRRVGGGQAYRIYKNDVGSGQAGDVHYTTDLHSPIARLLGFPGKGDIEVARDGTSSTAAISRAPGASANTSKTSYKPSSAGLTDGFWQGYQYGVDPTTGIGPLGALHAAITGAELTGTTTSSAGASSTAGGANLPAGSSVAKVQTAMMSAANHIMGRTYGHTGGHGVWEASNYDCSGAAGYVLHAAGLQPNFGWTGSDVSWGLPGPGKYITRGIRNANSQVEGHEMLKFFGRYLESGGGGPLGQHRVHWDSGWDGAFDTYRHPPGLRKGGWVPRGNPAFSGNADEADSKRKRFRSGGTINPPRLVGKPRLQPTTHHYPGRSAAPIVAPGYQPITTLGGALGAEPVSGSYVGVGGGMRGAHRLSLNVGRIASAGDHDNAAITKSFTAFAASLSNARKVSYGALEADAKHIQALIKKATRAGDTQEARRLEQALALVNRQEGARVGVLVNRALSESASIATASTKLQRLMTRQNIDPAGAAGAAMVSKLQDQAVKVLRDTVKKLQHAYVLAKKAGNTKAEADVGTKLKDAIDQLDQGVTDQISDARAKVEAAAQAAVDASTHNVTMAQTGEQSLQLQQQIAGTAGTPGGAQQIAAYIKAQVVPALQDELASLQKQEAVAKQDGNTILATQIAEAIGGVQNDILQATADATSAIKDATQQTASNTQNLDSTLGVTLNGSSLDNLAGVLNGG